MQWKMLDKDAYSGKPIIAIENFHRVDDRGEEYEKVIQIVFWHKKHKHWVGFGLLLESFDPTHYINIDELPATDGVFP